MSIPNSLTQVGGDPTSIGATSVIFTSEYSTGNFYFDTTSTFVTDNVEIQVLFGTSSETYTITSAATTITADRFISFSPQDWVDVNVPCAGLSSGTHYFYRMQWRPTSGGSWFDSLGDEGEFDTSASASPPTADFTVSTTTGVAPLIAIVTDLSSGTPTEWLYVTDPITVSQPYQNPHLYLATPGTYTVTQTVTNADGTDDETKTSLITVLSGAPTADFTVNTTTGTRPLTVTFTDSSTTPSAPITSYAWALPNGVTTLNPTTQNTVATYSVAGTYTATHTATNFLGSDSEVKTSLITVKPISVGAAFTALPSTGTAPLAVQFVGTPTGDSTGLLWDFGDSDTTTEANPLHTYYTTGTVTAMLTVYGTTAAGGAAVTVSTASSEITLTSPNNYGDMLDEIRRQLLMNFDQQTVCDDFVEFGGATTILRHIYNRICRIQLEAGPLRKTSTTISAVSDGVLELPADLIEIRSVYADGARIQPIGSRMADLASISWQASTTGDYVGWFLEPGDNLTLNLVPPVTPSTFEVYYVYAPTVPTVPGDCITGWANIPLPYVFWWIVKYGVLADMLSNEGPMYDIERANKCEEMFQFGIELVRLSLDGK